MKSRVKLVKPGSSNGCVERSGHGGDGNSSLRVNRWPFGRGLLLVVMRGLLLNRFGNP